MKKYFCFLLVGIMAGGGCATAWRSAGGFNSSVSTKLIISAAGPQEIYINNELKGSAPVTVEVFYEQKTNRKKRKVSPWVSSPGSSVALTIITLGGFAIAGLLPLDTETALETEPVYQYNVFNLQAVAPDGAKLSKQIVCRGEESMRVEF